MPIISLASPVELALESWLFEEFSSEPFEGASFESAEQADKVRAAAIRKGTVMWRIIHLYRMELHCAGQIGLCPRIGYSFGSGYSP